MIRSCHASDYSKTKPTQTKTPPDKKRTPAPSAKKQ